MGGRQCGCERQDAAARIRATTEHPQAGELLEQDFANFASLQKGMHSFAWAASCAIASRSSGFNSSMPSSTCICRQKGVRSPFDTGLRRSPHGLEEAVGSSRALTSSPVGNSVQSWEPTDCPLRPFPSTARPINRLPASSARRPDRALAHARRQCANSWRGVRRPHRGPRPPVHQDQPLRLELRIEADARRLSIDMLGSADGGPAARSAQHAAAWIGRRRHVGSLPAWAPNNENAADSKAILHCGA